MTSFIYTNSYYIIGSLLSFLMVLDIIANVRSASTQVVEFCRENNTVGYWVAASTIFFSSIYVYLIWSETMQIWMALFIVLLRSLSLGALVYSERTLANPNADTNDEDLRNLHLFASLANGKRPNLG